MFMAKFSFSRFAEIVEVAVQILKLIIATAADIVDDGKLNGSSEKRQDEAKSSN